MKPDVWNRLLDLLHLALMTPCRTKEDADRIEEEIGGLRAVESRQGDDSPDDPAPAGGER